MKKTILALAAAVAVSAAAEASLRVLSYIPGCRPF